MTELATLTGWMWDKIAPGLAGTLPDGMLVLKGGDLTEELAAAGRRYELFDISEFFEEPFFETKQVVYLPR